MDAWEQEQITVALRKTLHGLAELSLPSYLIAMVLLAAAVPTLVVLVEQSLRVLTRPKRILAIGNSIRSLLHTLPGRLLKMIFFYTWLAISVPLGALFMSACIVGKRADERSSRIAQNQLGQDDEEQKYREMARDIIANREETTQAGTLAQAAT